MNKAYRSIWNEALGAWVAGSEISRGRRKGTQRVAAGAALMLLALGTAQAQVKFGDNPTLINPGSMVEVESTDRGVLMPRVALTDRTTWTLNGNQPVEGMLVFNTAATGGANGLQAGVAVWKGGQWISVDETPYLHVNSTAVGNSTLSNSGATGAGSTAIGGDATATGFNAIALGTKAAAGINGAGGGGIAIGAEAQALSAGAGSTIAIGARSLASSPTGLGDSMAIGTDSRATGQDSLAVGGQTVASGRYSVAVGPDSTRASGDLSSAFGVGALATASKTTALGGDSVATQAGDVALGYGSQTAAVVNTTGTTIRGTAYTFAGTDASSTVSVGSGAAVDGVRTVTNVAAGRISAISTDAINGSQLHATNSAIEDLSITVAGNKTKYYSVNSTGGGNEDNLGATGTDAIASGKDASATGADSIAMGRGASVTATAGVNNEGTGGVAIGQGATVMGGNHLYPSTAVGYDAKATGISATAYGGHARATATDATAIGVEAKALGDQSTALGHSASAVGQATALGRGATAGGGSSVAIGLYAAASANRAMALGRDSTASVFSSVALGFGSVSDRAVAGTEGDIPAGSSMIHYNTTDRTLLGAVSVGSSTTYRQITNVADGTGQQDAVTVRQLAGALQSFAVTPTKYFHANSSAADSLAFGAESVAVGPQTVVNGNSGVGIGNGAVVQQSAPGGIAIGQAATSQMADSIALGTRSSAAAVQGVAIGAASSVTQAGGVALGAGSVASTAAGVAGYMPPTATGSQRIAIGATTSTLAAVSVGDAASGQFRQITGVAAGTADSDAVNVSQLKGVQGQVAVIDQSTVKYDTNVDGSVNYNSVTMGGSNATGPVTVHNVAPGVAGTDAVNVNQLNSGIAGANAYTDARVNALGGEIRDVAKNAYAGVAAAMAVQMPGSYVPGKTVMRVGSAVFKGESAVGVSFRRTSDNNAWSVTGGVGLSRAGAAATVGVEWVFN
ncbi:ESPR-type extended signal peptide-containing protein [Variovorax sp. LT1R16]|uniref:ESPR-type extended signal peptide-containing protein n=1 Tax=Variovorax sp. LT1R16 TaxID=3443728 RepID=UPI003F45FA52